jgi:hypothetical protein
MEVIPPGAVASCIGLTQQNGPRSLHPEGTCKKVQKVIELKLLQINVAAALGARFQVMF